MAELNLKQITDKLNNEFKGENRQLIFWFDSSGEFIDDINSLKLENAEIYRLEIDNQFYTKYKFEREDKENNYLIYAPFPKPKTEDNHLADTIKYSKEFFVDKASIISMDLGIPESLKPTLQKYIKFFASNERTNKIYNFEIDNWEDSTIELPLMSAICKSKVFFFDEIIRIILTSDNLEDNKYLKEFKKYNLLDFFWEKCKTEYGYIDEEPTLEKFIRMLFISYMRKTINEDLPIEFMEVSKQSKSGTIIALIDSLMNNVNYSQSFDNLSMDFYYDNQIDNILSKMKIESYINLEIFKNTNNHIINWIIEMLLIENLKEELNDMDIPQICGLRRKFHFGDEYANDYYALENAFYLIEKAKFKPVYRVDDIINNYINNDYKIDMAYRYFYFNYDKIFDKEKYYNLRELIENIYTNEFLNKININWTESLIEEDGISELESQHNFYNSNIANKKERTVVIISDALRFEVGKSLEKKLMEDEKCNVEINAMQGVIPSVTRFGMSALLPHNEIKINDDYKILVDNKICDDLKSREKQLQSFNPKSIAIQFDDIKTVKDAREITKGMDVIYIYHNQIDARGDKLNTENEVFTATEEAINEIYEMIKRLTSGNNTNFIITSDHGFIYKKDKLNESDKISVKSKNGIIGKRYIVTDENISQNGALGLSIDNIIKNKDNQMVYFPIASDVFKVSGGGYNFVHGGASLQEVIIPLIKVKTKKNFIKTKPASISLITIFDKITNLSINLEFIQNDYVSDVVKEARYKIYFISESNEKISNENIYIADNKDTDGSNRTFKLNFKFVEKNYKKDEKYYLIACDEKTNREEIRLEVQIDLAFTNDDYGFNL